MRRHKLPSTSNFRLANFAPCTSINMRPVQSLQRLAVRHLSLKVPPGKPSHGAVPNTEYYKKIQDLQNMFLRDDGLLVWQKRGSRDRIPYLLSVTACVVGMGSAIANLWSMSFPKKED